VENYRSNEEQDKADDKGNATPMKRSITKWEVAGIPLIFLAGSLLHFAYGWLGRWAAIGLFAAVNESVWEHLKLAFWPSAFYAIIEYPFLGRLSKNFFIAKAVGIWLMPITIVGLFYGYTAITGEHLLYVDITIFFIGISVGQLASYALLTAKPVRRGWKVVGLLMLLSLGAAFVVFTFAPPQWFIFRDAAAAV